MMSKHGRPPSDRDASSPRSFDVSSMPLLSNGSELHHHVARDGTKRRSYRHWIVGGGTIGAGCGAAIGLCTGPGAVVTSPTLAICGGIIGGTAGAILGDWRCRRRAREIYDIDRDRAIRNFVKCLRAQGVRFQ